MAQRLTEEQMKILERIIDVLCNGREQIKAVVVEVAWNDGNETMILNGEANASTNSARALLFLAERRLSLMDEYGVATMSRDEALTDDSKKT